MADVIDIEGEFKDDEPLRAGLRNRRRPRRARTGDAQEKPISRLLWIGVGAVLTALAFRMMDKYFPKQPQAALPPAPPEI